MKKPQSVIVEDICDGKLPDIKPPIKQKLVSFVKAVRTLRDLAEKVVIQLTFSCLYKYFCLLGNLTCRFDSSATRSRGLRKSSQEDAA